MARHTMPNTFFETLLSNRAIGTLTHFSYPAQEEFKDKKVERNIVTQTSQPFLNPKKNVDLTPALLSNNNFKPPPKQKIPIKQLLAASTQSFPTTGKRKNLDIE